MTERWRKRTRKSFGRIIVDFERWWPEAGGAELDAFRRLETLREVVEYAGFGRIPPGSKHSHMRRRNDERTLRPCQETLLAHLDDLQEAATFKDLHNTVARLIGYIWDAGSLTIYDMARWIGAWLGLEPKEIYLHQGTEEGAKAMGIQLGPKQSALHRTELPSEFWGLSCGQLEDLLCHYKDALRRAVDGEKVKFIKTGSEIPSTALHVLSTPSPRC
ncbi:hypothetical protein AB0D04_38740 [Streptomyces sp. NPDC048483]|uniref:hypothetical protein n=1 Tax=Streptomyces sp. NPDC048483 TaxID=3154927 RepID=UPI00341997E5